MTVRVRALDCPELPPFAMPDRFRHDITYFCTAAGEPGAPAQLSEGEFFIRAADARRIYDDGVFRLVSPLDSSATAEIEITEEQEAWLAWLLAHGVERVRLM
ncbi:MAG: hypothetical protein WD069_06470 [Planctomycetales bacterium]